ncbi:MAG: hypothetical protein R3C16_14125 [Hyphomonadaceae bacterium]
MAFWIWIVVAVALITGLSILVGKAISRSDQQRMPPSRQHQVTALKASGALRHRKSNQP